jgi:hypothetical protein
MSIRIETIIADLARCLVEEKPLRAQHRPDHIFTHSLCLACGLRLDLAVDIEPCVVPAEDLLYEGKADELFPHKQGEDFMGEDLLDNSVMKMADTAKKTIRGCAALSHQDMNMWMEVDAVTEGLDNRHHSRPKLKGCGSVQEFHQCPHCREA